MRKLTLLLTTLLFASVKGVAAPDDAIVFGDAAVEKICVDNWDANGDGKLSYAEAAAVTSLGGKFARNKQITSFDEFQYFTGVTETSKKEFYRCAGIASIVMPESIKKLGDNTFGSCIALKNVVLNEGLEIIDSNCFLQCTGLEHINIPDGVKEIGNAAFSTCSSLIDFTIPSKICTLPDMLFYKCKNLTNVVMHDNVTEIGASAFGECQSLESLYIGSSVKVIGADAFSGCYALKSFDVAVDNDYYTFGNGALFSKDMKALVLYCAGNPESSYSVPDGVVTVSERAFSTCKLQNIDLPESVDSLGDYAFNMCENLQGMVIPQKIKHLPLHLFDSCIQLKSVSFARDLKSIEGGAFMNCENFESVKLPASLEEIGYSAFSGCYGLKEVYCYSKTGDYKGIEESSILDGNWDGTALPVVYVPEGCRAVYVAHPFWGKATTIEEFKAVETIVFEDAEMEKMCVANWDTDGDGKLSYDEAAAVKSIDAKFDNSSAAKSFNEFKYFTGVTETGYAEFSGSSLVSITMPESMRVLGDATFSGCDFLRNVVLNAGLESIGENCFSDSGIESIDIPDNVSSIGSSAFMSCTNLKSFKMPANCNGVSYNMLCDCISLESVTLHDNVTFISIGAFNNDVSLKTFHFGKNIEPFNASFAYCSGLESITVDPENQWFTSTGNVLYSKDGKILYLYCAASEGTEYIVPDGVEKLESNAFEGSRLTKIGLPESIKEICGAAFRGCNGLESFVLPESVTSIKSSTFMYCRNLKSVTFSSKVDLIDSYAFYDCRKLEKIVLPETLTSLGYSTFYGCDNLNEIVSYSETGKFEYLEDSELIPGGENMRVVYVPYGCKSVYEADAYWANAHEIIEMERVAKPVVFEDAKVEAICVANWDADGDGKLNTDEAAAVTSLGGKFAGNTEINSFNEFKYFTGVTETAENEFSGSSLVSITMPESMKSLGNGTFKNCNGLKNVVLNAGLESIGENCFNTTGIESIDVPDNVNSIGNFAFMGCSNLKSFKVPANCNVITIMMLGNCPLLESVTMHDNVTTISDGAFNFSGIRTLHFGKNLQSICNLFVGCENIESITVDADNQWFISEGNVLYSKDGKILYRYCIASEGTEYIVPEGVEIMENCAFDGSKLTKISLPESLTTIGDYVFRLCNGLESIVLPESVTEISGQAFGLCENLREVTFSSKLSSIVSEAFIACSKLEKIVLPETLTEVGTNAFLGCDNLNEIVSYSETGVINEIETSGLIPEGENMRVVYVPAGCKSVYEANAYWANAHEIIEMQPTDIDGVNGTETITINGVKMAVNGCTDIYSVEGMLVKHITADDKIISLPAGVYVINGKKMVVR